jgi:hypothetical protein
LQRYRGCLNNMKQYFSLRYVLELEFKNVPSINVRSIPTVASNKFWSSMSFQNLVRLSKILKISLPDYAHVNKVSKIAKKMTINRL